MPKGGKKTVYSRTRQERMRRIAVLLARPLTTVELVRKVAEEEEISERQVYDDLRELWPEIQANEDTDQQRLRQRARMAWLRRIRKCEAQGKEQEANYALDRLCKIDGVYAPKKLEVSGTIGVSAQITSLVGVLDAEGIRALEIVQTQIAAARARGLLPAPKTPIDTTAKDVDE